MLLFPTCQRRFSPRLGLDYWIAAPCFSCQRSAMEMNGIVPFQPRHYVVNIMTIADRAPCRGLQISSLVFGEIALERQQT